MSVSRRKRSARMLQQYAKQSQSLLLYYNIVQIARLFFYRSWIPTFHDGDKPMMDLAQSLQSLQSLCVRTLVDMLRSVQMKRPWRLHRGPRGIQMPTQKQKQGQKQKQTVVKWSWTSRRIHKRSETKERWTSLRLFSRWTDHVSKEQSKEQKAEARSKGKEQSKSKARATSNRKFLWIDGRQVGSWRTIF